MGRASLNARTHRGGRTNNEDAFVCRTDAGVLAVIDGMGGQAAGEVAAAIAATAIGEVPDTPGAAGETLLAQAFRDARARILAHAAAHPAHRGMGAAATAVRLEDDGRAVCVAHVGDTRGWHVSREGARAFTRDHIGAQPDGRPALARDLGRADMPDPWVDTDRFAVAAGDLVVLASDGLHDVVPQTVLFETMQLARQQGRDAGRVAQALVDLARTHGTHDNVTVAVLRVGRWRRGRSARGLGKPLSFALFAVLAALAVGAALRDARWHHTGKAALAGRVSGTVERTNAELAVKDGLVIAAGATLTLRGSALDGQDAHVTVEQGGTLVVRRGVLAGGGLDVALGANATLRLEDVRVAAPLRVEASRAGKLELQDVVLAKPDLVTVSGGVGRSTTNLVVQPPAEPGEPAAP